MKVKHIKLENFQAHAKRLVKLSPNITTIIGASDRGKSAILRALGWVCMNNFPGAEFVRRDAVKGDAKEATVKVKVIDRGEAHLIERTRSASGANNTYELDGDEFKAFGQNVPDDITALLRLSPINFQSQHDSPFWFSETAGEVSRQLNSIIDLNVIDSSLAYTAKVLRDKETRLTICEERLTKLNLEIEKLEPQRERISDFEKLKTLEGKKDEATTDHDDLNRLLEKMRANRAKHWERKCADGRGVARLGRDAVDSREQAASLTKLLNNAARLKKEAVVPPDIAFLIELDSTAIDGAARVDSLSELIEKIERLRTEVTTRGAAAAQAEETFHAETDGQPCPLCGHIS